ncbi:MAG: UDP-N-acetylmuramate--L-alanine ligase [Nitrospirota bacterium]
MFRKIQQIHFVGIGGAGMSGIAEVLLTLGYRVTGSDLGTSETTKRLETRGGTIFVGHAPSNVAGAQVVVVSSAVRPDNVEVREARRLQIPVIPRAEMLAELMRLKYGIAIAGSHGKTTTTSMVATLLAAGGLDPTAVIGGKLNSFASHAKLGQGEFLVAEADESDGSFLRLSPTIVVVTNIDREHMDYYGDMPQLKDAFLAFINKVPFYGVSILCLDHPVIQELLPAVDRRHVTYGIAAQADVTAHEVELKAFRSTFTVTAAANGGRRSLGGFELTVPGLHNVSNALAAVAVGLELDLPAETIRQALREFSGVERRFQLIGEVAGVMVVDDYGHHPAEIKATLAAAKQGWAKRRIVLFQPHRYSRTRDLMEEFATAFYDADLLVLTEVYAAGEAPIEGVTAERLAAALREHGHKHVLYVPDRDALADAVLPQLREGDLVLTLGAGDIWKTGRRLLERLSAGGRRD